MPRLTHPAAIRVYAAAQRFIDNALRADDSLFTPGAAIWAPPVIDDLYHRFAEHPDESPDSFEPKFRRQLRGDALTPPVDAAPATYQLAGELLYIHLLPANGVSGAKKRQIVGNVLGWSAAPVSVPTDLAQTLDQGIARASQFFLAGRNYQVQFLLEFARAWKRLGPAERDQRLIDPWEFKRFLFGLPVRSAYAQRELLLHLIHPETFEPIMAREHKQKIVEAFASLTDPNIRDIDQQLAQVRAQITPQYGEGFHFYEDQIKALWQKGLPQGGGIDDPELRDDDDRRATTAHTVRIDAAHQELIQDWITRLPEHPLIRHVATAYPTWLFTTFGDQITLMPYNTAGLKVFFRDRQIQDLWFYPKSIYTVLLDPGPWNLALLSTSLSQPGSLQRRKLAPVGYRLSLRAEQDYTLLCQVTADLLRERRDSGLPRTLGDGLRPYVLLTTHLSSESYTPAAIRDVLGTVMPPIAALAAPPDPARLVDDLLHLRLLEPLDDGRYRRWPHLGDATPELLLKYAALTLLVPAGDDDYRLPALEAPFDDLPHPSDAWPLGEPLLAWYAEAGLAQRNADGTWQATSQALDPLDDSRTTAQALNTFLASLRRARSGPSDLPALENTALPILPPAVLNERITEIQRELLIDSETILRIYRSLIAGHHVILSGPPGTGKTHLARILPRILWRDWQETVLLQLPNDPALSPLTPPTEEALRREGYLVEVVTATEDWGVRHVIGGIVPTIHHDAHGSSLRYTHRHGCLTQAVLTNYQLPDGALPDPIDDLPRRELTDAAGNRYRGLWLVIDEFTRAQVDSAFGGLLTTLGGQRRPTLSFPTDAGERCVALPPDFRLIGTLNSFDRHFLNQISEAMKRRFTFIDVLPPGRERRDEEQATAIYRALSALAEQGLPGFSAEPELGRAGWASGLSVRREEQPSANGVLVRYAITWPGDPDVRAILDGLWRIFAAARVYRQLGTAQAETAYRTLFAGQTAGLSWAQALDSALADTLADQLQVIARDELRALLLLLDHPEDSAALKDALVSLLNGLAGPRQSAHLLQLRLVAPGIDPGSPKALTGEQVEVIFGKPAPLSVPPTGLFARRLMAFVNEQGL